MENSKGLEIMAILLLLQWQTRKITLKSGLYWMKRCCLFLVNYITIK